MWYNQAKVGASAMIGHKPGWLSLQEDSARVRKYSPPCPRVDPLTTRRSLEPLPVHLQRKIDARWKEWEPWVWLYLRRRGIAPLGSPELAKMRSRHSDHIVTLTDAGVSMRLIRRHRLDDPRIIDEVRALLVRAARERQRKAWRARPASPDPRVQWEAGIRNRRLSLESLATPAPDLPSQPGPPVTIAAIQKLVSELFQLAKVCDADLTRRSHRRVFVLPRQVAMYIVRQVTGASLQEIGRQFGMHHTTVLHSINKIEAMRRTDEALNRTITQLIAIDRHVSALRASSQDAGYGKSTSRA